MDKKEILACPTCGAQYRRPANLPPNGAEVRCRKCGELFIIEGDEEEFLTGAMIRLPSGRILRITGSTEAAEQIRAGVVTEHAEVSRNGIDWYPIGGFSSLRDLFVTRFKRPTLITPETEQRETKQTVMLAEDNELAATGDQIITATTPPREMTTLDRRIAPQSEPKPALEKPSDSLLDAIGVKDQTEPSAARPATKKASKEEDEEFNKLFESDEEEGTRAKPLSLNFKLIAAIAVIAGIIILVLLLVKSGKEQKTVAERIDQSAPAEQAPASQTTGHAPASTPAPQAQKETEELPKSDLVREQEEMMRRKPPREEGGKMSLQKVPTAPAPQAEPPRKVTGGGAKAFIKKGWALADKGDNDGAIEMFLRAVEIDPTDGEAYYGLGYSYQAKGERAKAKEYFQKALGARLKPQDKADIQSILNNL